MNPRPICPICERPVDARRSVTVDMADGAVAVTMHPRCNCVYRWRLANVIATR